MLSEQKLAQITTDAIGAQLQQQRNEALDMVARINGDKQAALAMLRDSQERVAELEKQNTEFGESWKNQSGAGAGVNVLAAPAPAPAPAEVAAEVAANSQ